METMEKFPQESAKPEKKESPSKINYRIRNIKEELQEHAALQLPLMKKRWQELQEEDEKFKDRILVRKHFEDFLYDIKRHEGHFRHVS